MTTEDKVVKGEVVKGEPDCAHGETFNITGIKQSLVSKL